MASFGNSVRPCLKVKLKKKGLEIQLSGGGPLSSVPSITHTHTQDTEHLEKFLASS